jgi:catechol 2,3-dioxygenase-like lactoylglutathione lyase family enzyme
MFAADRLDHVGFTARDVEALARWYETVFGMTRVHADAWPDVDGGHPLALDRANFEQAARELDRLGIAYEVWDHGICDSLYLSDPEGHQIELTTYRRCGRFRASSGAPGRTRSSRVGHARVGRGWPEGGL